MADQDESLTAAQFWHHRAAVLTIRLNFHHWLSRFVPKLFLFLVLLALFDLFRREASWPIRWSEALFILGAAGVAGWAWLEARNHFCSQLQALVRLETVLGLHNQLSSAQDGILPWPTPQVKIDDGFSANWKQILMPVLAGTLFLWGAHLVPVTKMTLDATTVPISEPPEFAQVQSWINALKADDLIEPDKLQEMQTALDKLHERPAQDWYTQSNLEAANSLKQLAEQSMNALAEDLNQADQAVEGMQEKIENSNDTSSIQPMQDQLRVAEENLASGNLPLKRELIAQLKSGESAMDKPLSASQLAALHQRLEKGKLAAQTAPKSKGVLSEEMQMQQAMANAALGHGTGRRRLAPGSGGLGGGEETAPLELQDREKTTPEGSLTQVSSDDMSRVALGETIKISASKPRVDPESYRGPQNAGLGQVQGSGGEAVWRSTYDPGEADTLTRFFK